MYIIKTSWEHNIISGKASVAIVNGAGGFDPLSRGGFSGTEPYSSNSPPLKGKISPTKNLKKGGMEKLLKGKGDPKKGGFCRKGGMLLMWVFFLAGVWQM